MALRLLFLQDIAGQSASIGDVARGCAGGGGGEELAAVGGEEGEEGVGEQEQRRPGRDQAPSSREEPSRWQSGSGRERPAAHVEGCCQDQGEGSDGSQREDGGSRGVDALPQPPDAWIAVAALQAEAAMVLDVQLQQVIHAVSALAGGSGGSQRLT